MEMREATDRNVMGERWEGVVYIVVTNIAVGNVTVGNIAVGNIAVGNIAVIKYY